MSVLDEIMIRKRQEVEAAKRRISIEVLSEAAKQAPPVRGFLDALRRASPQMALIAEVKKASPSKGLIRENFDPAEIAKIYEANGATALSVLTDFEHFLGSPANLITARAETSLPCLRKDFIYDPYQVYEARSWGADAILLIVSALNEETLGDLWSLAKNLGMDVLVEVHDEAEAKLAVRNEFDLVGINNRNLKDFKTTLETTERIAPILVPHALVVSESAIETHADVIKMHQCGAKAVLIGTTFCSARDIGAKVREVMGT